LSILQANFLLETTSQYFFTSPPSSHRAEKSPLPNASQGIFFFTQLQFLSKLYLTADVKKVWSNVRTLRGIVASYSQPQP
jgi:hypothetical protein